MNATTYVKSLIDGLVNSTIPVQHCELALLQRMIEGEALEALHIRDALIEVVNVSRTKAGMKETARKALYPIKESLHG